MLSEGFRRTRGVVGAWLRLREAKYNAAANALELSQAQASAQQRQFDELRGQFDELRGQLDELRAAIAELRQLEEKHFRLSRIHYDEMGRLREKLKTLRMTDAYAATFENRRPLISVPIATYNAAELLVERAIASVRAQTYDLWEIVVVGDGCTDDTGARLEQLNDPRIRFVNLPFRTVYPDDSAERWQVSGAAAWNHAVELSRGDWIAPLDDDDEFLPDHMKTLLDLALRRRAEYAYGKLERADGGADYFSFPPEFNRVGMQAAIYLRALDFFECDTRSWAVEEGTDWNFIRKMREAGVLMAATDQAVARYYPSMMGQRHVWAPPQDRALASR